MDIFADRKDLAFLFDCFDEAESLLFTETLSRLNHDNRQFTKAAALLDFSVTHEKPTRSAVFLISPPELPLTASDIRMSDGSGFKHRIDEMMNPEAIAILLGGEAGPTTIVCSTLRTNGETPAARSLFQRLGKIVKKHATRVDRDYVMPSARERFHRGWRLTPGFSYAPMMDLKLPAQDRAGIEAAQARPAPVPDAQASKAGATRKTFQETAWFLQEAGLISNAAQLRVPASMPQWDDDAPCGISLFKMGVEEMDLSGLEMPRSFLSRSEFVQCDFSHANLAQSNLCWSDFSDVTFGGANLAGADLRNASFARVDFTDADLSHADLRHAEFTDCTFTGANLAGAKLGTAVRDQVPLSFGQYASIAWTDDEGDDAPGG